MDAIFFFAAMEYAMSPEPLYVDYAIASDFGQIVEVEQACFDFALSRESIAFLAGKADHDCIVLKQGAMTVGYLVYSWNITEGFAVVRIAIVPHMRRRGLGRSLVRQLQDWTRPGKEVSALIDDSNLAAHKFFAACGFKAVEVVHWAWGLPDDAYRFKFVQTVASLMESQQ